MKYTALTIGPIIKTLMLAHRTKELWAASYFFSYFMEKIIENIEDKKAIILPYPDKRAIITERKIDAGKIASAGIFPDRLLLQSKLGMYDAVVDAVKNAIAAVATEFNITVAAQNLEAVIYAHIIEFDYARRPGKDDDNIVFQTNDYLANCELQAKYVAKDDEVLLKMLDSIDASEKYKEVFGKHKNFPSIIEIATRGLKLSPDIYKQEKDEEDDVIWSKILDEGKREKSELDKIPDSENRTEKANQCKVYGKLKTAHKYIAMVQADGDNVGTIIKKVAGMQDHQQIFDFSKCLSEFSLLAAQEIAGYGGTPVYVGGDDLLFFAPVVNGDEHIFKLLIDIDRVFKATVTDNYPALSPIPSMSYGVSITYYKYPMHEALAAARGLLFGDAKEGNKNAIAFRVLKHSGQQFGATLPKGNFLQEPDSGFKPIETTTTSTAEKRNSDAFSKLLFANQKLALHSVIYNMDKHKAIFEKIIGDTGKLKNFFANFYNEKVHDQQRAYFDTVSLILTQTHQACGGDFEKTKEQVYAQLRLIQFLNSKNDE
jgi:CRISPR-associated protein Cmr2